MKPIFVFTLLFILRFSISAQNMEVEGKTKITEMDNVNTADSVVVWLPDGTLGVRDKATLTKGLQDPVNQQDAATKSYVDGLITQIMNDFSNDNETFTSPTTGTLTDSEGNVYDIVKIGGNLGSGNAVSARSVNGTGNSQWWMAENLSVTTYNDGTPIALVGGDGTAWTALSTPAYCWYENDKATYGDTYGALYNFFVGADTNSQNVCPVGWHVPSDADWTALSHNLDPLTDPEETLESLISGGKLKEAGFAHWDSPNEGATNESGFTALAAGSRLTDLDFEFTSEFSSPGSYGIFWSSTESDSYPGEAYERALSWEHAGICRCAPYKQNGFSIRCMRN